MKVKSDTPAAKVQSFELELGLLVEEYHEEPARVPYQRLAEATGRVFAQQCLREYGYSGYQYAEHGIQAILLALRDMSSRRLIAPPATEHNQPI